MLNSEMCLASPPLVLSLYSSSRIRYTHYTLTYIHTHVYTHTHTHTYTTFTNKHSKLSNTHTRTYTHICYLIGVAHRQCTHAEGTVLRMSSDVSNRNTQPMHPIISTLHPCLAIALCGVVCGCGKICICVYMCGCVFVLFMYECVCACA